MLTRLETLIICVLFIAGLLLTGGSSHARSADTELGPGDVLYISLPGEETLNRTFKIDRLGRIELPEVGEVEVSGRPLGEIEVGLRRSLSTVFRDMDQFEVTLKERRKLITVLGYVNEPGMVDLPGDASVQEAITAAGGLVPGAQLDRLQLRRGSDRQVFDFKKYLCLTSAFVGQIEVYL
ncbi:MAG: polysaccharide export protein [Alphaproteobacteria bacterium]|nr:polysaccharide export protein [Alphaproteobacteria bacterium]